MIRERLADEACEEYIKLADIIENKENQIDKKLKAEFYGSFAYFLFDISEYESSLNMFIKAQNYGYSNNEIKKIIWDAFIEPNLNEFKSVYEQNIEFLLSNGYILKAVDFNELSFWLIPTLTENEYYLYDKNEDRIKERICLNRNFRRYGSLTISEEFSDFLIVEDWDWNKVEEYVNSIRRENKKVYIVINDFKKFLSVFQGMLFSSKIISDVLIFDGLNCMKEYFKSCSEYLPRNVIDLTNKTEQITKTIDGIHNYRISKEGRKGDNILLSIGIPSYNRGNRAYDNIIHSLQCHYDEEIEFVLSNNGTQNDTKKDYEKIAEINDSRINYFAFEENQGVAINISKVCEMAHGKFILLISDEDLVDFSQINKVLNTLNNMKETLAILKTRGDCQAVIPSTIFAKAGREAMLTYMLTSNYLSGIIFNNELIKKYKATEQIRNNLDNTTYFYYPHMFIELLLCQYGDVKGIDIVLINEGKAEITEVERIEVGEKNKVNIPYYNSIEGRLEQHKGFLDICKELEICKKDFDTFKEMYIKLCIKTIFLVNVSIQVFYKYTDEILLTILNKAYEFCIGYLDEVYSFKKHIDKKDYMDSVQKIKIYYEYYKQQI